MQSLPDVRCFQVVQLGGQAGEVGRLNSQACPDARIGASREVVLPGARAPWWLMRERTPGSLFWVQRDCLARRTVPALVNREHLTEASA